jgi:hypothetical protein
MFKFEHGNRVKVRVHEGVYLTGMISYGFKRWVFFNWYYIAVGSKVIKVAEHRISLNDSWSF